MNAAFPSTSAILRVLLVGLTIHCLAYSHFGFSAEQERKYFLVPDISYKSDLTPYLSYIRDDEHQFSINDILNKQTEFIFYPDPDNADNFGLSNAKFWYRIEIKNSLSSEQQIVLEMDNAVAEYVDFYTANAAGGSLIDSYTATETGARRPFSNRAIKTQAFAIPITLESNSTRTIYVSTIAPRQAKFPFYIYSGESFEKEIVYRQITTGLFIGIILGLLGYNCFIYFMARMSVHLYYLLLTFVTLCFTMTRHMFIAALFPESPNFVMLLHSVTPMFFGLSLIQFFRVYLDTPTHYPLLDKVIIVDIFYFFIFMFWLAFEFSLLWFFVLFVFPTFIFSIFLVWASFDRWRKGFSPAIWILAGICMPIIGHLSLSLAVLGVLPHFSIIDLITNNTEAIQLIVFSLGLAEIVKQMEMNNLISEKKAISEKINNRIKSDFLSRMNYLIRTPMNTVVGNAELLKQSNLEEDQKHYISTIESSCLSLLTIIDDIIEFTQSTTKKYQLVKTPFNIATVIQESVSLFKETAAAKDIQLTTLFDDQGPFNVVGDPIRLRQILLNLMSNAFKFTAKGQIGIELKLLHIAADKTKCKYQFSISDTGIGISAEGQKNLFHSFQQAERSTSRKYGGTGLGLNISKQLVELMGGKIGVNSKPGEGSTFWFDANFSLSDKPDKVVSVKLLDFIDAQSILLTGYNETALIILQKMLATLGFSNHILMAPSDTINCYCRSPSSYQLLIIDFRMKDFETDQTVKKIRLYEKENDLNPIRIIACSAHIFFENDSTPSVFDNFIRKPVTLDNLNRVIRETVGHKN